MTRIILDEGVDATSCTFAGSHEDIICLLSAATVAYLKEHLADPTALKETVAQYSELLQFICEQDLVCCEIETTEETLGGLADD